MLLRTQIRYSGDVSPEFCKKELAITLRRMVSMKWWKQKPPCLRMRVNGSQERGSESVQLFKEAKLRDGGVGGGKDCNLRRTQHPWRL